MIVVLPNKQKVSPAPPSGENYGQIAGSGTIVGETLS